MVYYYLHIYIGLFKITGRDAYGGIGEGIGEGMHMVESVKLQSGMIRQHHMTLSCGVLDLTFAVGSEQEKKNTKLTL